jgi:flagellar hook-length control protein FliK
MKVEEAGVPPSEASQPVAAKRSNPTAFSQLLEQKAEAGQKKKRIQPGVELLLLDGSALMLPAALAGGQMQPGMVSQLPAETRVEGADIKALVQEILVVSKPNEPRSVEIQFNSKTLDGLQVQIKQDRDQIAIRFSTASESISDLLSRNLNQLTEALHSKGLQVGPIQVERAPTPIDAAPGSGSATPRDGRRGQSEERQQRQQQQQQRQR